MYWIYLTGRKTKVGYGFDYCEDIHTERWKNDIDIVFTSRGNKIVCSLIEYDFRRKRFPDFGHLLAHDRNTAVFAKLSLRALGSISVGRIL